MQELLVKCGAVLLLLGCLLTFALSKSDLVVAAVLIIAGVTLMRWPDIKAWFARTPDPQFNEDHEDYDPHC